jgi:hypothetical protein
VFAPYRSFQKYCSQSCREKVTKKRPSRYSKRAVVERACKQCGAKFETNDSKRHYCSRACYTKHETARRAPKEARVCLMCGERFETSHWVKRYCSEECRVRARRTRVE